MPYFIQRRGPLGFLFSLLITLSISVQVFALDKEVQALIQFETQANAVSTRSAEPVQIEHFEIPYALVEKDLAEKRIPKELMSALLFQKGSTTFIRWIINPEDSKWKLETEAWLKSKNVEIVKGKYFTGYQTASRSYIVEDPKSGFQFSCKVSTDKTGGNWTDKKQTFEDAWQIRMLVDFIMEEMSRFPNRTAILLDEPAVFGLKEIDQGMVIRLLGDLPKSERYYLPGFSAVHEEVGALIAKKNGSNDPAKFWNDNYNKPLGRALAELFIITGVSYDSPHSQNFLIELDKNLRPTGRIVLRDFGDVYVWEEFFKARGRSDIPKRWEQPNVIRNVDLSTTVGLLHGNTPPSWLNNLQYQKWAVDFFREFDQKLAELSGLSRADLKGRAELSKNFSYSTRGYLPTSQGWKTLLKEISLYKGLPKKAPCRTLFGAAS